MQVWVMGNMVTILTSIAMWLPEPNLSTSELTDQALECSKGAHSNVQTTFVLTPSLLSSIPFLSLPLTYIY